MNMQSYLFKLAVLIFIVFITDLNSFGQAYHHFLKSGKKWQYIELNYSDCGSLNCSCPPATSGYLYFVSSDTIIQGNTYSKILVSNFYNTATCPPKFQYNKPELYAFYREDTLQKKVFVGQMVSNNWEEKLVYNFDLKIGDSIPFVGLSAYRVFELYPKNQGDTTGYLKVISSQTKKLATGDSVKSYTLKTSTNTLSGVRNLTLAEGIGGESSIKGGFDFFIFEATSYLSCVTENETVLLNEGEFPCDFVVLDIESTNSPSGSDPHSTDFFPPEDFSNMTLYDTLGKEIAKFTSIGDFISFCTTRESQV
ncbi:MAG: hypothetical protein K2Q22_07055, partial [Cytophagales bacterium]|nr:hypothetical protein [Cytophagales bacterium]